MGNMLGNMLGNSGSMGDFGSIGNFGSMGDFSVKNVMNEAKNNFVQGTTNPFTTPRETLNSNAGRLAASFLGVQGGELKTVSLIPRSNIFTPRTNTFTPPTTNPIGSNATNAQNRSRSRGLIGGNYKYKGKYKKRKRTKKYIK
jgi:hypothetical protein